MRIFRRALVLSLALLACEKRPAAPDFPLLLHVPADTPYVFATLEPVPRSYWERLVATFGKDIDRGIDSLLEQAPAETPTDRFARGFLLALRGKISAAGMRELFGVTPEARAVLYGVGLVPVVRFELVDDKALPATVERLAREAGLTVPMAAHGDRRYWRFEEEGVVIAVAVVDKQLVVAGGPRDLLEAALPNVLGLVKPKQSMAGGAHLREVMAKHGFLPWVGYADAQKLLPLVGGLGGPPCRDALAGLAKRIPRVAVGYDEWTDRKIVGRLIVEMEPALSARLKELVVDVPGFGKAAPKGRSFGALGAGMRIDKGRELAIDAAAELGRLGAACDAPDLVEAANEARAFLSQPLPPALDKARGALVEVLSANLAHDGNPTQIEGFALVAVDDGAAFFDELARLFPNPDVDKLARDGKFHQLVQAPYVGALHAAVQPKAVAVAAGPQGIAAAEGALATTGEAPLFYLAYDYGRIMELMMRGVPPGQKGEVELVRKMSQFFGVVSMSVYPSDAGLVISTAMDTP